MQLLEPRRTKRRRMRWKKYVVIAGVAVAGLAAWKGWDAGRPRYLQWKQNRALEQAKAFIEQRDAPNAQLALEVALKTVPGNPNIIRAAATLLEQVGSPQAMRLRRTVVQLVPDSADDAAALVLCCLQFRDINAAQDALARTPHEVSVKQPMLHAALTFALTTGNAPVAEMLFDQLKREFPSDQKLQVSQALFHLRHPLADQRKQAMEELDALVRANPSLALTIHREIADAALQRKDYGEAKHRRDQVLSNPAAIFADHLQKANFDLLIDHVPFDTVFAGLAKQAAKSETDAVQFVQWLAIQNKPLEADRWIGQLPSSLRETAALKSAQAEIAAQLKEWDRLNALVEDGAWGPVTKATVRLAFAAKTVDNPARPSLRRETWEMAISSAGSNPAALNVLQRLASIWQWNEEVESTLWTIARTYPDQTWAHQTLFNIFREKKNANGMKEVMAVLRSSDSNVPRYRHDWALLSLLTEPTSAWNVAKDTMARLYESNSSNPSYATGYAFALAQAGKATEALAIIEKLRDAERDYPPRQPYLAFVYGVAKKSDDLERAITLSKTLSALPEENYLFTRAREELNRKPERPKSAPPPTGAAKKS